LLAGASGLVGRELLADVLADPRYISVFSIGRRMLPLQHAKLTQAVVGFDALPTLPAVDDVFIALGTTRKAAGSELAMRAVDFDAVLAVATAGLRAGAQRLGVVSSMGADARSRLFYPRLKGEMECALGALGYAQFVVVRPSQLEGDRRALGQADRLGESLSAAAMRWLKPLIPRNFQLIAAADVAAALLAAMAQASPGRTLLLSGALQGASR
jgi:uncharacterized protein YbjT (DUF2867 family)